MANNVYLASKPRYEILDGLRGVAAFCTLDLCLNHFPFALMQMNWLKRNKTA